MQKSAFLCVHLRPNCAGINISNWCQSLRSGRLTPRMTIAVSILVTFQITGLKYSNV
jgi:hypothetical protein